VASIPLRVCCVLPTARPRGPDPTSVGFRAPSTTSLALAPYEATCHVRLGSALRLSQPLSGFLASSSFTALFRAATVRGVLPSEVSPRKNRAPLSRPLASAVIHRCARTYPFALYHRRFHRRPHPRVRLPGFPDDYEVPLTHRGALPSPSELERAEPSCSASFIHFEAFILLRVRSHRPRLPRTGRRSSRGFLPP
jgi:hypothetical protein